MKYYLTANHISPDYRFHDEPVKIWSLGNQYSADHKLLGCGKKAATPEQAIYRLAADNGCTAIRVRHEPLATHDECEN